MMSGPLPLSIAGRLSLPIELCAVCSDGTRFSSLGAFSDKLRHEGFGSASGLDLAKPRSFRRRHARLPVQHDHPKGGRGDDRLHAG